MKLRFSLRAVFVTTAVIAACLGLAAFLHRWLYNLLIQLFQDLSSFGL